MNREENGGKEMLEYERHSVIDPVGRVFYYEGEVYRGIYENEVKNVLEMFECGLIDELNSTGMIPKTEVAQLEIDKYPLILHHEKISNPAYIQEWSFSMIKDAALLILELEEILLKYGYCLKDGHAYNVMFRYGKPVYVDIGSITKFVNAGCAVREFYAYYDQILQMFSCVPSIARERLLSRNVIGVRYNLYYLEGLIHGNPSFQSLDRKINAICKIDNASELLGIIEKEKEVILSYDISEHSIWEDYQDVYMDKNGELDISNNRRFETIVQICKDLKVTSVLELAANQGILSRMLSKVSTISDIYATDYDEGAVDKLYQYIKSKRCDDYGKQKIYPMVYDVTADFLPVISSKTFFERTCSDVVIACALMHHLILSQHINIDAIFDKLNKLSKKYLIIEFMPLGLWGGGEELPPVPSWYTEEWFVKHMKRKFEIIRREDVSKNRVLFVAQKL